MYGLINVFATQQFRSFRRLFSLLLLALARRPLWVNFYANDKQENNDVSEDAPIVLSTEMAILSRDYNQELHCKF